MTHTPTKLPPSDGDLLRAYLLGQLAAEAREGVERRLLLDSDLFELAEAIEEELTVDALAGRLSDAERRSFAGLLAASPETRAHLALSRDLAAVAARRAPGVTNRPAWRWPAAIAASLAAALGAGVFFGRAHQTAGTTAVQRPAAPAPAVARAAPAPPLAPTSWQAATPAAPTRTEPSRPPRLVKRRGAPPQVLHLVAVAALRGSAEETPEVTLHIEPGRNVELRIEIDEGESYPTYRVAVRDAAGREVASAERLERRRTDDRALVVRLTAGKLQLGWYEAVVYGRTGQGEIEEIGSATFAVTK